MLDFLLQHWLPLTLIFLGLCLAVFWQSFTVRLLALTCLLLGSGGLAGLSSEWALGVVLGAGGVLFVMLIGVVLTGLWSAWLGYGIGGVLIFGLGAWGMEATSAFLVEVALFLASLDFTEKWWLLGLLLIPVLIAVSYGRLTGLGPTRRRIALGLRCLLVALICLALAETHASQVDHDATVLFLIDRSKSVPIKDKNGKDERQQMIFNFIDQAVSRRGPGRTGDRAGVIVFGRGPRLELPPAKVSQLPIQKIHGAIDDNYTDIGAALKLALASFPEGASKRIVLFSDGNENLGNAVEQARLAKHNGVRIYAVALASGRHTANEVTVERIEAPAISEKNSRVPLRVVLRSYHPDVVVGKLQLTRSSLDLQLHGVDKDRPLPFRDEVILVNTVKLRQGLNVLVFQQPGLKEGETFTYEARFIPTHVETALGKVLFQGLPGDRVENNRASTTVMARGQRAILLVESKPGEHKLLVDRLQQGGSLRVIVLPTADLPKIPARLAMILNRFDSVILANVPAEDLTEAQQSVLRSNTHEQGAGLVMIGGPSGFGAGGWQDTELEKAFPVTCDTKSTKIDVKGGLVLIMHASEIFDGNAWQKKIAKLAIDKLSAQDMVGLTLFDTQHRWHIPFKQVGGNRAGLLQLVNTMDPGDMMDCNPSLKMALSELANPAYKLGTKHIIFISDGDHWDADAALLKKIGKEGITLTTVCITSHGQFEVVKMAKMAADVRTPAGKRGASYHVKDARQLPAIYLKETRLVSQSFIHDKKFDPIARQIGPMIGLPRKPPPLYGFVRTTKRPSPLVEVPIKTPVIGEDDFPILAYWQYGLGRSVAFTSDARTDWDRDWVASDMHEPFWKQVIEWSRRPEETGKNLSVTTDQRDGKVRVIVEALDDKRMPITKVEFQTGLTALSNQEKEVRKIDLKFEQKSAGIYEAEFQAEEVGSYLLNIKGAWAGGQKTESIRAGVTIPYSPELGEIESNPSLLEKLAKMTGGTVYYEEDTDKLAELAASGELFQPVDTNQHSLQSLWYWLVILAGMGLFFDVAVRRISIEPAQISAQLQTLWASLRGRQTAHAKADPFIERLKSRKAQVDDTLAKDKSARRFEAGDDDLPPPPPGAADAPPSAPREPAPKPPPAPSVAPEKEKEAADYASRLMRAKRRAQEDRGKK